MLDLAAIKQMFKETEGLPFGHALVVAHNMPLLIVRIEELEAEVARLRAAVDATLRCRDWQEFLAYGDPALRAALEDKPIPDVAEDSTLDELLAWGHAVVKAANITPEGSRELLRLVRRAALETPQ